MSVSIGADQDGSLYQTDDGSLSNGAGTGIFAGRTNVGGVLRRGVIHFPVETYVPAGATITNATLALYLTRASASDEPVSVHRLLVSWGEGASVAELQGGQGAPSVDGDATWIHRFWDSEPWDNPGGDFDSTASATTDVGILSDRFEWTSDGLVDDVQRWIDDPATNFGWLLVGNEDEVQTAKRFRSRENLVEDQRPELILEYIP